ncbi:Flavodoxin reductases (ferredoxin-NADPH reductases) family 1; Vanillate O-demethylase oxidoreductase, partial [hydrothermal vent metagenome]
MQLIVTHKHVVAADTVCVRFASAGGGRLTTFKPGAHIEMSFFGMMRRYSLTSLSSETNHYEICVLRTNPNAGGSAYIHDRLKPGDTIEVSEPQNDFPLNCDAAYTVFVAGGIGITPFYTMMDALHRAGSPFELHYAARAKNRFLPIS